MAVLRADRPKAPHVPPSRGARRSKVRRNLIGFAFMTPLLVVNIVVIAVPASLSVWYSFTDWTGLGPANFVGLDNYTRLFGDPEFR
ncbi:sugar ABC transporter permease, partial [Streptomyces sp. NPDC059477]